MSGYNSDDPISLKYMGLTGRWIDYEKEIGYWGPLAQQEVTMQAQNARLAAVKLPDVGGDRAFIVTNSVIGSISAAAQSISAVGGVKSRVMALLRTFVSEVYYEREFAALAETEMRVIRRGCAGQARA
jgi:hypothetical protein